MIDPADSAPLARFTNPTEALSHLDAEHAGALIASAADVALVLDRDGVILDTAFSEADLSSKIGGDWIGRIDENDRNDVGREVKLPRRGGAADQYYVRSRSDKLVGEQSNALWIIVAVTYVKLNVVAFCPTKAL